MANRMPDENRQLAPAIGILLLLLAARAIGDNTPHVERWGLWDMALDGPAKGNPYVEVRLTATFERGDRQIIVPGFWDGGDKYRIRFSPPEEGEWRYVTGSNRPELDGRSGKLTAVAPAGTNHGPVQVFKTSCLRYADGSPYHQFGTTCYAWTHQPDALQEQTLRTLAGAPFNKIRFCVFPKSYAYNTNEPPLFPFSRRPDRTFDFDRPDPAFWRQFEGRILDLQKLGIEADIILWHPYDRWGFSEMLKEQDDRYLRYCIARLSAFRNVWWSLANEYDLMAPGAMKGHRGNKTMEDWDRFFQILASEDSFQRLRSIHNCRGFYDHTRPWVTHASLQISDMNAGIRFRAQFGKPVIYDECKYEGDVPQGWGNLTPREMTQRFWLGTLGGCYVGHGETYLHPEDILWWSKGGALHGKSAGRIQWLKDFMAKAPPFHDLQPTGDDKGRFLLAKPGEYYLLYARSKQPQALDLAGDRPYKVDRIDPWEMTISPLGTAPPGAWDFAPPQANMVYRFVPYAAGEPLRPDAAIDAAPAAGRAPLPIRFSAPAGLEARWDFGDGSVSAERAPTHVFAKPGLYVVTLTVTDAHRGSATAVREVAVDRDPSEPLLRLGFPKDETHALRLSGTAKRTDAGGFRFPDGAPWGWAETGVVDDLRGLRSFTIAGWLKPDSLAIGAGGNRILFCLNHDRDGIDLVCHADGLLHQRLERAGGGQVIEHLAERGAGEQADRIVGGVEGELGPDLGADVLAHRCLEGRGREHGGDGADAGRERAVGLAERKAVAVDVLDHAGLGHAHRGIDHAADGMLGPDQAPERSARIHRGQRRVDAARRGAEEIPPGETVADGDHGRGRPEQRAELRCDHGQVVGLDGQEHHFLLAGFLRTRHGTQLHRLAPAALHQHQAAGTHCLEGGSAGDGGDPHAGQREACREIAADGAEAEDAGGVHRAELWSRWPACRNRNTGTFNYSTPASLRATRRTCSGSAWLTSA